MTERGQLLLLNRFRLNRHGPILAGGCDEVEGEREQRVPGPFIKVADNDSGFSTSERSSHQISCVSAASLSPRRVVRGREPSRIVPGVRFPRKRIPKRRQDQGHGVNDGRTEHNALLSTIWILLKTSGEALSNIGCGYFMAI